MGYRKIQANISSGKFQRKRYTCIILHIDIQYAININSSLYRKKITWNPSKQNENVKALRTYTDVEMFIINKFAEQKLKNLHAISNLKTQRKIHEFSFWFVCQIVIYCTYYL
jgi:hypothetical protein